MFMSWCCNCTHVTTPQLIEARVVQRSPWFCNSNAFTALVCGSTCLQVVLTVCMCLAGALLQPTFVFQECESSRTHSERMSCHGRSPGLTYWLMLALTSIDKPALPGYISHPTTADAAPEPIFAADTVL
jgi:hypothetical protein